MRTKPCWRRMWHESRSMHVAEGVEAVPEGKYRTSEDGNSTSKWRVMQHDSCCANDVQRLLHKLDVYPVQVK
jgi:hypothetical protein